MDARTVHMHMDMDVRIVRQESGVLAMAYGRQWSSRERQWLWERQELRFGKPWCLHQKQWLRLLASSGLAVFLGLSLQTAASAATGGAPTHTKQAEAPPRSHQAATVAPTVEYTIVTNEIKSTQKGHPKIEAYRFDPGVIVVNRGDDVVLHFYGVKGPVHPITIAAYGVRTTVSRGEIKTVRFHATHAGYFPIVCEIHRTVEQHGPMVGTLVVLP